MNSEQKKKRKKYVGLNITIIAILILIPIILDRFFTYEMYTIWESRIKRESVMNVGEWFGFLGSYFGAVGTIFIGIVAYMQTDIINKQSQHMSTLQVQIGELQKEINVLQLHPIIRIKDTKITVRDNLSQQRLIAGEIEDLHFAIYGEHWDSDGIRYIMITINFEDCGLIPTVQCELSNIKWNIAGKIYDISLAKKKRKINTLYTDVVKVLIEESDIIAGSDSFFRDIDIHEHNTNNGTVGYEKSTLTLNMRFINQKGNDQTYKLACQISSFYEGLKVDSNFAEFLESGKEVENGK